MAGRSQDFVIYALLGRMTTGESGFKVGFRGQAEEVPIRQEGGEGWIADGRATVHTTPSTDNMIDYVPAELGANLSIASRSLAR